MYKAFGISSACNLAIACMGGALDAPCHLIRNVTMFGHAMNMMNMSMSGEFLGRDWYLELLYTMTVYHMVHRFTHLNLWRKAVIAGVGDCIRFLINSWDTRHDANCCHEESTIIGRVYGCAKSVLAFLAAAEIPRDDIPVDPVEEEEIRSCEIAMKLEQMSQIMQGANSQPLKWASHEDHIPSVCEGIWRSCPTLR